MERDEDRRKSETRRKLTKAEAERWLEEHAEVIESWNRWVEEHGLPLEKYRRF